MWTGNNEQRKASTMNKYQAQVTTDANGLQSSTQMAKFETMVGAIDWCKAHYAGNPYVIASVYDGGQRVYHYESLAAKAAKRAEYAAQKKHEIKYRREVAARSGSRRGFTND